MIKILFLLGFISACAHHPSKNEENLVSLDSALKQAHASYLRGCVEAHKKFQDGPSFPSCKEKAKLHQLEVMQILQSP